MKTAARTRSNTPLATALPGAVTRRSPVGMLWAAAGAVSLSVIAFGWIAWITSPDFETSPKGPDPISDTKLVALHLFEATVFAVGLAVAWRYLLRPLWRERTYTFDGMLLTAMALAFFFDPLDNYFNYTFSYNAHFLNFASWTRYIPGWESPNQQFFPEPILVMTGFYVIFMFGSAVFGCWFMRRLSACRPRLGNMGLFAALFGVVLVLDFVVENVFMRTQFAAYPGTVHDLTLFAGKYYQFPLYEPVLIAGFATGLTALRWFRDDRGQTFAERGLEEVRIPPRGRKLVSFLAITGFAHVWFVVGYFVPYNYFALKADTFPPLPSFLRAGICGDGTGYACPSEHVPIPRRGSLHVTPDDPRLPAEVRERQGLRGIPQPVPATGSRDNPEP